jgi:hypothetical protein
MGSKEHQRTHEMLHFPAKKSFEKTIRKSLVFPFFDLKIMILHRGWAGAQGICLFENTGKWVVPQVPSA